jgi:hypothetical protein
MGRGESNRYALLTGRHNATLLKAQAATSRCGSHLAFFQHAGGEARRLPDMGGRAAPDLASPVQ